MYPFNFPKDPPFLRIVNPNPKEFTPTPNYKALQSESDAKSYLLNNCLQAIKGWKANDSHVTYLMIEVNDLIANNYPFVMAKQQPAQNQYYGQGWNNNGYNPQQQQNKLQNNWGNQSVKQPPIPFKSNVNSAELIAKGQKYAGIQKKKLGEIKQHYVRLLPALQQLEASKIALDGENSALSKEIQNMISFINHSDEIETVKFANLVVPAEEFS